jgi:hypothetical protein
MFEFILARGMLRFKSGGMMRIVRSFRRQTAAATGTALAFLPGP